MMKVMLKNLLLLTSVPCSYLDLISSFAPVITPLATRGSLCKQSY